MALFFCVWVFSATASLLPSRCDAPASASLAIPPGSTSLSSEDSHISGDDGPAPLSAPSKSLPPLVSSWARTGKMISLGQPAHMPAVQNTHHLPETCSPLLGA